MIVDRLDLTNFRSYDRLSVTFGEGLNILVGPNGAGKTNLVEAIHYLSFARSFRTPDDSRLIKRGTASATIRATIKAGKSRKTIAIGIDGTGKKVLANDKPVSKLSELLDLANVIVFKPRDVLLFNDFPKERRRFLDVALMKQSHEYLTDLNLYERILKERNELLKQEKINQLHLQTLTEQLVTAAKPIMIRRGEYLQSVNEIIGRVIKAIRGDQLRATLIYDPFIPLNENYEEQARNLYRRTLESDIKRKVTTEGAHREDFRVEIDKEDIAEYGSQGENRLLAIALKLSSYFLIEEKERRPIVVLDDVLSELDTPTQERLLHFLTKFEQTFVTTTKYDKDLGTIYDIENSIIKRRNPDDK